MITKMKQILGAAAAMLMLAACGSPKTNLPLEGTQWKLTEMDGKADPAFAAGEDTFNFTLDPSRMMVYGVGACNRLFGPYELEEGERTRHRAAGQHDDGLSEHGFGEPFREAARRGRQVRDRRRRADAFRRREEGARLQGNEGRTAACGRTCGCRGGSRNRFGEGRRVPAEKLDARREEIGRTVFVENGDPSKRIAVFVFVWMDCYPNSSLSTCASR